MKKILILFGILASTFIFAHFATPGFFKKSSQQAQFKDGDIIFIVSTSGQGKAIQLATKSKFTHVGIIFHENGKAKVYHAVEPVSVNTVEEFVSMSADGKYEIRRLKNDSALNTETVAAMLREAKSHVGTHYDIYFNWKDNELYCSEFVWKLYQRHTKLEIGKLRPMKDFDLSSPIVKEIMKKRYGNHIPYDEKMISPGDMYNCDLLK